MCLSVSVCHKPFWLCLFCSFCFAEIEAKEACTWLRAAGFPQYAQLYEGKDPPWVWRFKTQMNDNDDELLVWMWSDVNSVPAALLFYKNHHQRIYCKTKPNPKMCSYPVSNDKCYRLPLLLPQLQGSVLWPYQLPLCNQRLTTAGPSYLCQQLIACSH